MAINSFEGGIYKCLLYCFLFRQIMVLLKGFNLCFIIQAEYFSEANSQGLAKT